MKKIIPIILVAVLAAAFAACGKNSPAEEAAAPAAAQAQQEVSETPAEAEPEPAAAPDPSPEASPAGTDAPAPVPAAHSDVLVAFFSATGTTKGVAERLASVAGGDLYEILAAEPYTADDLNYNNRSSRSTKEQNDKNARPAIGSEEISLAGYTTVYLGFPIWWGEEPRILDTFVEKYSFEGVTVIPFCTSGGSGIGRSGPNMEALAGTGTWLDGKRFSWSVSEADLQSWVEGLK